MSATINVTESDLMTALRGFLFSVVDSLYEVDRGQDNRVSMPDGKFIVMTTLVMPELNKPYSTYTDGLKSGTEHTHQTKEWICQLDIYSKEAATVAATIATLMRSSWGVRQFAEQTKHSHFTLAPLYAGEPHQNSMINGEKQYENRWTLDLHLQFTVVIDTPAQFADKLTIKTVSVDTSFPPEPL